jgi:hypothetical protein
MPKKHDCNKLSKKNTGGKKNGGKKATFFVMDLDPDGLV